MWEDRLREDAELRVDLSLTIAAASSAYPHLVEMEMALGEAAADASTYALRRVGGACRAALEALFQHVASQYPLRGIASGLYVGNVPNRNRQFIQDCYRIAAKTIGVAGESLFQPSKVKPEHIKAGAPDLYDSCVSVLLSLRRYPAARQVDHPLQQQFRSSRTSLTGSRRSRTCPVKRFTLGHITFTLDHVRVSVRTVYEVTSILMNLSYEEVSAEHMGKNRRRDQNRHQSKWSGSGSPGPKAGPPPAARTDTAGGHRRG